MSDRIPILDLTRSHAAIRDEILEAVTRVIDSQSFILGKEVRTFEEHIESYLGGGIRAVGCASGSDALVLALKALDLNEGDEVITTAYSFFATVAAIVRAGGRPVLVDIDPGTYNIDMNQAALKVNPKTKALLPVHLFGQMADIYGTGSFQRDENTPVIVEDAAQAFGAWQEVTGCNNGEEEKRLLRAGESGTMGCYSFFPTKNLGGYGDGGMVVSHSNAIVERLLRLRVHGESSTYLHQEIGFNSRLDAIQAAVLDVKLRYVERWNTERRQIADRYKILFGMAGLEELVSIPKVSGGNYHVYHQYVVRVPRRDELQAKLEEQGITTRVYYPVCLHLQPCFSFLGYGKGDFPEAEKLSQEALALPIFPGLLPEEQERVVNAIAKELKK